MDSKMKKSTIFWNVIILLVETIIGLIFFYSNFLGYLMVLGMLHSIFLLGLAVENKFDKNPYNLFLLVSYLGILMSLLFLIIMVFIHPKMLRFWDKFFKWIPNTFNKINEKLDK